MNKTVCQGLLNFHWDTCRQGIEVYPYIKFRLPQCFLCQLHAHTCPLYNVLLEVVCCCFPRNKLFAYMTMFVGSQSFISLPSFMFVSTPVSGIREWRQKKQKNSEIEFNTFPGHIVYPFFNQGYLLSTCMH